MKLALVTFLIGRAAGVEVHPLRSAQLAELWSQPNMTWKVGAHPRFAAFAPGATQDLCGAKGDQTKILEEAISKGEIKQMFGSSDFVPEDSFDSAEKFPQCAKVIGDIRDQSNCGCCWAFAGAEAASDRMCIATGAKIMYPLSAQDVCFSASFDGCGGGSITAPWNFIKQYGAVTGGQYNATGPFGAGLCSSFSLPHCHHHGPQGADPYPAEGQPGCASQTSPPEPVKCDADAAPEHNQFWSDKYTFTGDIISVQGEAAIQQAITEGGPVEVAFTVYSDFENYAGGIYKHVTGDAVGGHAVKIVGWGVENNVKYWKVANSWNSYWGEKGYFRILRGTNECNIESQVAASAPDAKWAKRDPHGPTPPPRPDKPCPGCESGNVCAKLGMFCACGPTDTHKGHTCTHEAKCNCGNQSSIVV